MKKAFPFLAFVLFVLMFTSCRKDYECVCTTTKSVRNHHRRTKVTYQLSEFKKRTAAYTCSSRNAKYLDPDGITHVQVFCRVD